MHKCSVLIFKLWNKPFYLDRVKPAADGVCVVLISVTIFFPHTSWGWRTLLRVSRWMRCSCRGVRFCPEPLLIAEFWKLGGLRACLPGRIQEVAVCTAKSWQNEEEGPEKSITGNRTDWISLSPAKKKKRERVEMDKIRPCASFLT